MEDARRELYVRALALPGALVAGWIATAASPGPVRMISMWVHESGHAAAAWLTGYLAFPGPWFTPVDLERSVMVTLVLAAGLAAGGYRAWQLERWFWVTVAGALLACALIGAFAVHPLYARQLITFAGDGGCFAIGTLLMLTMYADDDHALRRERLRWVCLIVGALAFMDARATWFGPAARLPLGGDDRGLSDASVLTESYGWTLSLLVSRYTQLATGCVAVLALVYLAGLAGAYQAATSSTPSSFPRSRRTAATH